MGAAFLSDSLPITTNTERGQLSLCCGRATCTFQFGMDGTIGMAAFAA